MWQARSDDYYKYNQFNYHSYYESEKEVKMYQILYIADLKT